MYALIATVKLKMSTDDLKPLLASYSRSLTACPGHAEHFWLRDGEELALLHLFEDEAALECYGSSGMLATLTAHPACAGPAFVRRYRLVFSSREEAQAATLEEAAAPVAAGTMA